MIKAPAYTWALVAELKVARLKLTKTLVAFLLAGAVAVPSSLAQEPVRTPPGVSDPVDFAETVLPCPTIPAGFAVLEMALPIPPVQIGDRFNSPAVIVYLPYPDVHARVLEVWAVLCTLIATIEEFVDHVLECYNTHLEDPEAMAACIAT